MPKHLINMSKQTLAAYLPADLARRARTHAKATRRSLSSVIAEAVAGYFDRLDLIEEIEHEAILQRLSAVAAREMAREAGEI